MTASHVIFYGRFVDDKQEGVYLEGVYFGGAADTGENAEKVAAECTKNAKRGIYFPRVFPVSGHLDFPVALADAKDRFAKLEASMIEAEDIHRHNQNVAKKRRTK